MNSEDTQRLAPESRFARVGEVVLLVLLFFVYAGDAPPMVNEAHYLVKAKNYWQPDWCASDLFASSGKAHVVFYFVFGWPTQFASLATTAWLGRLVGWTVLAIGLARLTRRCVAKRWASLVVAIVWIAGIQQCNLAGEWVIGGMEAKVPAYGLVLIAMADVVDRRWNQAWVWLGIASAFHVLTGGWSVVATVFAWWITERTSADRKPLLTRWLFIGGLLSLPGLIPAIELSLGAERAEAIEAAKIYTYMRLNHHLLPSAFAASWYARHVALLLGLTMVALVQAKPVGATKMNEGDQTLQSRNRRLLAFVFGAILIAVAGLCVGLMRPVAPELTARMLRYYWFRLSDAVVPLGFALLLTQILYGIGAQSATKLEFRGAIVSRITAMMALLFVCLGTFERMWVGVPPSVSNQLLGWDADADRETQRQVFDDWIAVCQWARDSTPEGEVFLTPRHQQTFKWYAHRGEVVNWKDVPQDATSLLQWRRRFFMVYPENLGYVKTSISYRSLRGFREQFGVRYMIVDRRVVGENLPLIRLYPYESDDNQNYAVYELPR